MLTIIALLTMATRFISLSDVLMNFIARMNLQKEMTLYQISEHWEEIVGPQIAAHTAPETLRFETLSLSVDSAPWMNQLTFFKKEIIEKTNQFLKKRQVREMFFRLAPPRTLSPKKEVLVREITNQHPPLIPEEVLAMDNALKGLQDKEIRKKIAMALTGYFQNNFAG